MIWKEIKEKIEEIVKDSDEINLIDIDSLNIDISKTEKGWEIISLW